MSLIRSFQDRRVVLTQQFSVGTYYTNYDATGGVLAYAPPGFKITGNGSSATPTASVNSASLFQVGNPVIGHKYYLRISAKVTNAVCSQIRVVYGGVNATMVSSPANGTTYDVGVVITATSSTDALSFVHVYADSATANTKVMEVYDFTLIDLTEDQGTGNEYTANETTAVLDANNQAYFSGTYSFMLNDYTTLGDKVIQPRSCFEKKEDNGDWRIELEADISYLDWLANEYVLMIPTKADGNQPFRIWKTTVTNSVVKVIARHIGFDLESHILEYAFGYSYTSNVASHVDRTLRFAVPQPNHTSSGSAWASGRVVFKGNNTLENMYEILAKFGGHLVFNGWNVEIAETIGTDNGIVVEYGKNLEEAEAYEDWSEVCTTILPIGDNNLLISEVFEDPKTIDATGVSYAKDYYRRVLFPGVDNATDLIAAANAYLDVYKYPKVNYSVSTNVVQNVALGDTIKVNARQFEITTTVLAYTYDVLAQRITDIEFGNFKRETKRVFSSIYADMDSLEKSIVQENITINEKFVPTDFTPTIQGTTTAGTGTYTVQVGKFTRIGDTVNIKIDLSWTAHTGTGNMVVAGLPVVSSSSIRQMIPVYASAITLGTDYVIQGYIDVSSQKIVLARYTVGGGGSTALPMDSSGTLLISGDYYVG